MPERRPQGAGLTNLRRVQGQRTTGRQRHGAGRALLQHVDTAGRAALHPNGEVAQRGRVDLPGGQREIRSAQQRAARHLTHIGGRYATQADIATAGQRHPIETTQRAVAHQFDEVAVDRQRRIASRGGRRGQLHRIVIAERDHAAAEMRRAARGRRETHRVQAQPPRQRQRQAVGQLQGVLATQGQIIEAARGNRFRPDVGDAVQGIRHHITRPQSAGDKARARMQRQRHGRGGERQPHRRPGDGNAQAAGPGTCTEAPQRRIQRHALARGKIDAAGGAGDPLPAAHAVRGHDIQIGRQRRHVQHRAAFGDQVTATGVDGDTTAGQHIAPQPPERIGGDRSVAGRQQPRRRRQPDTLAAIERVVAARPGRRQRDAARRRQQAAGDRQTVGRRQGQPALGLEFDGGAGFHRQGAEQRTAGAQGKLSRCPLRQRLQADFGKRHHIAAAAGERNIGRRQQVLLARLQVCAARHRQAVGATHRIRGKAATGEKPGIEVQHPRLVRRRPTDLHLAGAQRQGTAAGNAVTEQLTVQAQLTGLRNRNAIGRKAPNRQADTAALTAFEPAVRAYLTSAGDVDQTAAAQGQVGYRT